jgi:hypothetical protein
VGPLMDILAFRFIVLKGYSAAIPAIDSF